MLLTMKAIAMQCYHLMQCVYKECSSPRSAASFGYYKACMAGCMALEKVLPQNTIEPPIWPIWPAV